MFDPENYEKVAKYRYDRSYTDEQLLDSLLQPDSDSKVRHFFAIQSMRMYRADSKMISKFILGNYSLSMFLLIPIFGLILNLIFRKNKIPFVGHLIHSLQLHTFTFFIFSIGLSVLLLFEPENPFKGIFTFAILLTSIIYIAVSFKRVYKRGIISTFFRWLLVGGLYFSLWFIILTLDIIVSFLLY